MSLKDELFSALKALPDCYDDFLRGIMYDFDTEEVQKMVLNYIHEHPGVTTSDILSFYSENIWDGEVEYDMDTVLYNDDDDDEETEELDWELKEALKKVPDGDEEFVLDVAKVFWTNAQRRQMLEFLKANPDAVVEQVVDEWNNHICEDEDE